MSHNTRSQIQKTTVASTATPSTSTTNQGALLSQAEAELLHKQLDEREKMIREQANALRREREEVTQQQTSSVELEIIIQTLKQLQSDIMPLKNLQEKLENLEQRVNEPPLSPSLFLDATQTPATVQQTTLKIKDVLPNIPNYGWVVPPFDKSQLTRQITI